MLGFITLRVGTRNLSLAHGGRSHYQDKHTLKLLGNIEHGELLLPATELDRVALIEFLQRKEVIEKIAAQAAGWEGDIA